MKRPWHPSEVRMLQVLADLTPMIAHRKAVAIAKDRECEFEMNVANTYGVMLFEHAVIDHLFGFDTVCF